MNTKDIIIADKIIRYENYQFRRLFGQANEVTIQDVRKYLEEDAFSPYEDLSDDALKLIYIIVPIIYVFFWELAHIIKQQFFFVF